ncbi:hypothetical protein CYY_005933 [Polysphondylium violaceum]|uniref:Transmembrane protein n=1 Tax=Polysphondylium violaceum TaxID=133409 RepID=A0A8J4PRT4_9MYCE|nr:hypothetical protein CYY_005933 [Polysphondylium violaceum]
MGCFEGNEIKVQIIYLICILLCILGIINAFSILIIGIIICIGTIGVAICGAAGARFKMDKLLFYFTLGLLLLMALCVVSIAWQAVKAKGFSWWMLSNFVLMIVYGTGIFVTYLLRGRTLFRSAGTAQNASFQKL